jgi:hypothetical protein
MPVLMTLMLLVTAQTAGSLGRELLARNLPAPRDAQDLELPITSYSVLDDDRGFVIAYYLADADNSLHELRVRSFDQATRAWRSATFSESIGSVLSIGRKGAYLYLTGHSSPSATPLLVLDAHSLARKRELDGWPVLMLDDGRVVFSRSMIHFAPTHAEVLALYDPRIDREETLYPGPPVQNHRGGERIAGTDFWIERSLSKPRNGKRPGTIEFTAIVQRMRLNSHQIAEPAAQEERYAVTCDLAVSPPSCKRR